MSGIDPRLFAWLGSGQGQAQDRTDLYRLVDQARKQAGDAAQRVRSEMDGRLDTVEGDLTGTMTGLAGAVDVLDDAVADLEGSSILRKHPSIAGTDLVLAVGSTSGSVSGTGPHYGYISTGLSIVAGGSVLVSGSYGILGSGVSGGQLFAYSQTTGSTTLFYQWMAFGWA